MYIKALTENEKELVNQRLKNKGAARKDICFGCYNFESGDIFPDDGLIFMRMN